MSRSIESSCETDNFYGILMNRPMAECQSLLDDYDTMPGNASVEIYARAANVFTHLFSMPEGFFPANSKETTYVASCIVDALYQLTLGQTLEVDINTYYSIIATARGEDRVESTNRYIDYSGAEIAVNILRTPKGLANLMGLLAIMRQADSWDSSLVSTSVHKPQ